MPGFLVLVQTLVNHDISKLTADRGLTHRKKPYKKNTYPTTDLT